MAVEQGAGDALFTTTYCITLFTEWYSEAATT